MNSVMENINKVLFSCDWKILIGKRFSSFLELLTLGKPVDNFDHLSNLAINWPIAYISVCNKVNQVLTPGLCELLKLRAKLYVPIGSIENASREGGKFPPMTPNVLKLRQ